MRASKRSFYAVLDCFKCRCRRRHILVRSRQGGFVSWDCEICGAPRYVSSAELPAIDCNRCGGSLVPGKSPMGNYAYRCPRCVSMVELADLVPRWQDLFDFHGLSIDPDYGKPLMQDRNTAVWTAE